MKANKAQSIGRKAATILLLGTAMPLLAVPAVAQVTSTQSRGTIKSISVVGSQRIEPDTVRSYVKLRAGTQYSQETLDEALRDLAETELFAECPDSRR